MQLLAAVVAAVVAAAMEVVGVELLLWLLAMRVFGAAMWSPSFGGANSCEYPAS